MRKIKFKVVQKNDLYYLLCKRTGIYGFIIDYWKYVVNCDYLGITNIIGTKYKLYFGPGTHIAYKDLATLETNKEEFIEYIKNEEIYNQMFYEYRSKPMLMLWSLIMRLPDIDFEIEDLKSVAIVLLAIIALLLAIFK